MSWYRILGVFYRYLYVSKKGLHQLSDLFYWPLVDILIWGLTSYWIQSQGQVPNLPLILMTGLIYWQITWRGSVDISTSLLMEFWHRNLVNLFSTPLKISEWVAGMILLGLCKIAITIAFGSLLVYLLFSLNIFNVGWFFLPFAASLLVFGWSISFLSASLIINYGNRLEMIAWMAAFVFAPFSAVFYPVHVLPEWAQIISWCLPTTYIFEGMRSIIATDRFPFHYFWASLGLNAIYLAASVGIFKLMFENSRKRGIGRFE
ncbi:MAG TPA: ABC transporter permease [Chlamydiales bacterium]|nr:ABC transporter permease [Chlamydiales bacterium]